MKILVTLKRIPDPEQKLKFKPGGLDLSGANWVPNQFDEYAVEAALRLIENASAGGARSGEIVVASIGPKEVQQQLRSALAMGADRAILVDGSDDQLDAEVVSRILLKLIEKEKPDLVLMGKLAADGEGHQVGQLTAGYLGWPQATFAATLEVTDGDKALLVGREVDGGTIKLRVELPAVVSVDLRIVAPKSVQSVHTPATHAYPDGVRFAALMAIMAAKKKPLAEMKLADLTSDAALKIQYLDYELPPARKAGVKVKDVAELVSKLKTEAKVV